MGLGAGRGVDHFGLREKLIPTVDSIGPSAQIFGKFRTQKEFYETRCSYSPPAYEIIASKLFRP